MPAGGCKKSEATRRDRSKINFSEKHGNPEPVSSIRFITSHTSHSQLNSASTSTVIDNPRVASPFQMPGNAGAQVWWREHASFGLSIFSLCLLLS
jgi:hypothetical protein